MTTSNSFRPLLAASIDSAEQLEALSYPMIASPKVDGIRVLCHPQLGPVTRSLKPVRSTYVRSNLEGQLNWGFDGEVTCGPISAPNVFNRTTTGVMAGDSQDEFTYWVFDDFTQPDAAYSHRHSTLCDRVFKDKPPFVSLLPSALVYNPEDVTFYEQLWLADGFEGVMLRHMLGRYKYNRSTFKEGILLKLKRFEDAEAEIIGFEPLFHNTNTQTRNHLGLAERSDHKDGKVQAETLGNLLVRDCSGRFGEFSIGSGFDQALRQEIWDDQPKYLGKIVTFKYQKVGVLEKPRFPIFARFRADE